MTRSITLSCSDYDILRPLLAGTVGVEGVDVEFFTEYAHSTRFEETVDGRLDVAEFTLGAYVAGWPDWAFTAIPAFPRRFFPHSSVFVNTRSGIRSLDDLAGKRVGVRRYANTVAIWLRGILAERYHVADGDIDWYVTGPDRTPVEYGDNVHEVHGADGPELLDRGTLDALVAMPQDTTLTDRDNVDALFPDPRDVERSYYEETGVYPLVNVMVVRDGLLEAEPDLPRRLLEAFRASREVAAERELNGAKHPLVWWDSYRREERAIVGDVWLRSFEFGANEDELDTMIRYSREQGLTDGSFSAADIVYGVE